MGFSTHIHKIKLSTTSSEGAIYVARQLLVLGVAKFEYTYSPDKAGLHKFTNISDEDLTVDDLRAITLERNDVLVETYSRKKGKDGW